ncbi:Chromodomain-helicase-DNA-binding protein 3 [Chlorella vulgaris]
MTGLLGGNSQQLEGRSASDRAWYDCDVSIRDGSRDGSLFLRFSGYGTDEEEPLTDLSSLRYSSLAANASDCVRLVPGTLVSGFKRSVHDDLWIDAEVVGRQEAKHAGGKCRCSFTVKWLDTADAGKTAELGIGDICLPDSRSLEQHHPKFRQYKAILDKAAQLKLAGKQRQSPQQRRRASAVAASPDVVSEAEEEGASEGDAQAQDREGEAAEMQEIEAAEEPRQFVLRPPQGASGPLCVLCKLPTLLPADPAWSLSAEERREVSGLYGGQHVTHWRCAAFGTDPGLAACRRLTMQTEVPGAVLLSFSGGVRLASLQKCTQCGQGGAATKCAAPGCRKYFHLHCAKGCKVDVEEFELRQAELESMRTGRVRRTTRLQGLDRGPKRCGVTALDDVRRTERHANKRVRYNEAHVDLNKGFTEGWQRSLRNIKQGRSPSYDSDQSMDEDGGIQYDDNDSDGSEPFVVGEGRRVRFNPGRSGKQQRQITQTRRTGRDRTQVKSYAEVQEELEFKEQAFKQAEREKSGYGGTRCQICDAKNRAKEMLLCDHCDQGYHMHCLEPPLEKAPLGFWFCPRCLPMQSCEACGQGADSKPSGNRAAASESSGALSYCATCGALCHLGCLQQGNDEEQRCELCCAGLREVEAVLGCRTLQQAGAGDALQYHVKWKGKGYRHCRWITEAAALRLAPSQLQRFVRDARGAATVEPNIQQQWMQVERIVATRFAVDSDREECLVKWRGLEYDKATWEPRDELAGEAAALQSFERRMALRVERDAAVEAAARKAEAPGLNATPEFLEGVGSLKDYQIEGVDWVLGKLRGGMSVILGDEMGLGKTIQAAVFLQLARERRLTTGPVAVVVPLSTFGSWERELAKWAPGLEVLSYSGQQEARALIRKYELGSEDDDLDAFRRSKNPSLKPRFHVMLTTYDIVIRDCAMLKRFDWSAVVIDEGHSLKGQDSLRGRMLRDLGAPWRLLMTGTPLQNNLRELLALLAFLADCSIEDIERRIKRMEDPNPPASPLGGADAAAERDEELLQAQSYIRKLHAYLEPRMLRRMKAICLAGQMPPKISRKVGCRMTPLQLQLYTDVLAKDWDRVNAMVKNKLEKKSMNNILMRLRQTCNHPYLLPGQEPEEFKDPQNTAVAEQGWRLMVAASGKLTLLQQMLPRLLAGGHRVLIFSQYIEMLDILEDFLHDFQDTSGLLPKAEEDAADGCKGGGNSGGGNSGGGKSGSDEAAGLSNREGSKEPSPTARARLPAQVQPSDAAEALEAKQLGQQEVKEEETKEEHEHEEEEDFVRGRRGSVIRYFRLDGSTKGWQRQAMMDSFNSLDCKVKVFLISTRAGSLGINLQTANTVVLYDPDFNPFVDAQAEGRAHRLGQEETVLVYQLHTVSSVEERILALAARKRKLEELVTKHLGRGREAVSDEDIKSSVLHGWGNLMRQADEDRQGGSAADTSLSEVELARLLDREHVFADDLASGADAATLLGEVRAGGAAAMKFDGGSDGGSDGGAQGEEEGGSGRALDAAAEMEAAMKQLLSERARQYEADKAAKEELGRGRRARGAAGTYCERDNDKALLQLLKAYESPDKAGKAGYASSGGEDSYRPRRASGGAQSGSGAGGTAGESCSIGSSDSSDSEAEGDREVAAAAPAVLPAPPQVSHAAVPAAVPSTAPAIPIPACKPQPVGAGKQLQSSSQANSQAKQPRKQHKAGKQKLEGKAKVVQVQPAPSSAAPAPAPAAAPAALAAALAAAVDAAVNAALAAVAPASKKLKPAKQSQQEQKLPAQLPLRAAAAPVSVPAAMPAAGAYQPPKPSSKGTAADLRQARRVTSQSAAGGSQERKRSQKQVEGKGKLQAKQEKEEAKKSKGRKSASPSVRASSLQPDQVLAALAVAQQTKQAAS